MALENFFDVLPDDWQYITLGEACKQGGGNIQTGPFGSQLHASDYVETGIPTIMPQNIGDNRVIENGISRITEQDAERLAKYRVRTGDIVYSRRGDVERRSLIRKHEDGWLCGTGSLRVRFGSGIVDPVYASFYLGHPSVREWIVRHAHGATMPNLNTSILSAMPFALPPLPEQRSIAAILGSLDDKIELNRQMNRTLEAMAQALFKSWFVDFDPVRAKAEGRETGLPDDVAALFPDRLVESELGEIPEGWSFVSVVSAFDVNPPRSLTKGQIAPYLDMANMPTQGHHPESWTERPFGSGMKFINGDTLLARITPCLENGKTAFVDFLADDQVAWGSTEYIVLRPKRPLPLEYAYFLARHENFRTHVIQNMTGTSGRQRASATCLEHYYIALPSEQVSNYFDKLGRISMSKIKANMDESRTLTTLRDTLLPKLISGEVRVKDVERFA